MYGTPSYWMQQFFRESSGATLLNSTLQTNSSDSLIADAITWKDTNTGKNNIKIKVYFANSIAPVLVVLEFNYMVLWYQFYFILWNNHVLVPHSNSVHIHVRCRFWTIMNHNIPNVCITYKNMCTSMSNVQLISYSKHYSTYISIYTNEPFFDETIVADCKLRMEASDSQSFFEWNWFKLFMDTDWVNIL